MIHDINTADVTLSNHYWPLYSPFRFHTSIVTILIMDHDSLPHCSQDDNTGRHHWSSVVSSSIEPKDNYEITFTCPKHYPLFTVYMWLYLPQLSIGFKLLTFNWTSPRVQCSHMALVACAFSHVFEWQSTQVLLSEHDCIYYGSRRFWALLLITGQWTRGHCSIRNSQAGQTHGICIDGLKDKREITTTHRPQWGSTQLSERCNDLCSEMLCQCYVSICTWVNVFQFREGFDILLFKVNLMELFRGCSIKIVTCNNVSSTEDDMWKGCGLCMLMSRCC